MKKRSLVLRSIAIAAAGVFSVGCDFPYQPVAQQPPTEVKPPESNLWKINTGNQICNPSVSQNDQYFKACMLFLNLGGLSVKVPSNWQNDYPFAGAKQHDRLTIVDSLDTVRWFMMKPSFIQGDMQDPEWSSHPNYAAFLGYVRDIGDDASEWNGFVVRLSDKQCLKFNNEKLQAFSTPFVWVDSTVPNIDPASAPIQASLANTSSSVYDSLGLVDTAQVRLFFGTRKVKMAYNQSPASKGNTSIWYIDYSESSPVAHRLARPSGKDGNWDCESPLISLDGKWITYNCKKSDLSGTDKMFFESYIQFLAPDSKPVLISTKAAEPHWYANSSGAVFIEFCTVSQSPLSAKLPDYEFNPSADVGITKMVRVFLPAHVSGTDYNVHSYEVLAGEPVKIADIPFQGGISRDGNMLCTGYQFAYFYRIP